MSSPETHSQVFAGNASSTDKQFLNFRMSYSLQHQHTPSNRPAWRGRQDTALRQLLQPSLVPPNRYPADPDGACVHRASPGITRLHGTGACWLSGCFKLWSAPERKYISQKYDLLGRPKIKKSEMHYKSDSCYQTHTSLLTSLPLIYVSDASSSGQAHTCFTLTQVFFSTHLCCVRWPFELTNSPYKARMFP